MAKCDRCAKRAISGRKVSHAENKTKRKFKPNVQKITYYTPQGEKVTSKLCASCIKRMKAEGLMFKQPPEDNEEK
jgi:large subunit ribosomal protein L28